MTGSSSSPPTMVRAVSEKTNEESTLAVPKRSTATPRASSHLFCPSQVHQFLVQMPRGDTTCISLTQSTLEAASYSELVARLVSSSLRRDVTKRARREGNETEATCSGNEDHVAKRRRLSCAVGRSKIQIVHRGDIVNRSSYHPARWTSGSAERPCSLASLLHHVSLRIPILGGIDRQNRVGSKFGGGGVSSSQNAERERKERLKKLALESIDLAKDPYLMRNHLGTYECKLCLTLHTNEANYLAHTQGKKHQQGLARRAHMEKLRQEREQQQQGGLPFMQQQAKQPPPAPRKVRIGRPAYQVFKSRDPDTHQRCLSFELSFPEMDTEGGSLQPRHRFMSAFEQRVETPPDRRYQFLLFAAEPYETVAFKIPNEPLDKGEGRFVTYWDAEEKKFTLTLHFLEQGKPGKGGTQEDEEKAQAT